MIKVVASLTSDSIGNCQCFSKLSQCIISLLPLVLNLCFVLELCTAVHLGQVTLVKESLISTRLTWLNKLIIILTIERRRRGALLEAGGEVPQRVVAVGHAQGVRVEHGGGGGVQLAQAQGQEATQGGVQARGGEVLQGQPGGAQQRLDALQGEVLYYSTWRQKEGDG